MTKVMIHPASYENVHRAVDMADIQLPAQQQQQQTEQRPRRQADPLQYRALFVGVEFVAGDILVDTGLDMVFDHGPYATSGPGTEYCDPGVMRHVHPLLLPSSRPGRDSCRARNRRTVRP